MRLCYERKHSMRTRPISISRSNPAPIKPAVLPPTHYLQLPPTSTTPGSQQLKRRDQGVCKPNTAVKKFELLANVGTWLKESSTCATVSSFEQVRAASARRTLDLYPFPYARPTEFTLNCVSLHPSALCHHPRPQPHPHNNCQLLSVNNVTTCLKPKHQLFSMPPANSAEGNGRCASPRL